MELLTTNVMDATGLDSARAKAALGHVLLFLRDEVPQGHVAEFIDKMPQAREAVNAAAATGDGGVTAVIEGMTSFMGHGRADVNILAGKLENIGLDETQIVNLVNAVVSRAEILIGADGAAKIRQILPALAQRSTVIDPMGRVDEMKFEKNPGESEGTADKLPDDDLTRGTGKPEGLRGGPARPHTGR